MRAVPEASNGIKKQIFPLNYINNQPLAAFLICNKSFHDLLHGMVSRHPANKSTYWHIVILSESNKPKNLCTYKTSNDVLSYFLEESTKDPGTCECPRTPLTQHKCGMLRLLQITGISPSLTNSSLAKKFIRAFRKYSATCQLH